MHNPQKHAVIPPSINLLALAEIELAFARIKHPKPYSSFHEGYAVLLEEFDEFWAEIKKQSPERDPTKLLGEVLQIAAVCDRIADDLITPVASETVFDYTSQVLAAWDTVGHCQDCDNNVARKFLSNTGGRRMVLCGPCVAKRLEEAK